MLSKIFGLQGSADPGALRVACSLGLEGFSVPNNFVHVLGSCKIHLGVGNGLLHHHGPHMAIASAYCPFGCVCLYLCTCAHVRACVGRVCACGYLQWIFHGTWQLAIDLIAGWPRRRLDARTSCFWHALKFWYGGKFFRVFYCRPWSPHIRGLQLYC